jgi:hypothetical protein
MCPESVDDGALQTAAQAECSVAARLIHPTGEFRRVDERSAIHHPAAKERFGRVDQRSVIHHPAAKERFGRVDQRSAIHRRWAVDDGAFGSWCGPQVQSRRASSTLRAVRRAARVGWISAAQSTDAGRWMTARSGLGAGRRSSRGAPHPPYGRPQ